MAQTTKLPPRAKEKNEAVLSRWMSVALIWQLCHRKRNENLLMMDVLVAGLSGSAGDSRLGGSRRDLRRVRHDPRCAHPRRRRLHQTLGSLPEEDTVSGGQLRRRRSRGLESRIWMKVSCGNMAEHMERLN